MKERELELQRRRQRDAEEQKLRMEQEAKNNEMRSAHSSPNIAQLMEEEDKMASLGKIPAPR